MPSDQKFEIPEELRQLAEENVERARKLYLQFMEGGLTGHGGLVDAALKHSVSRLQ